ncbi:MAG: YebC/PmpR family DNA-binding transcriptional regulator [Verrucomicrobiae bacterium]|nr:YebC/PmpR family DNA-binding transcriptional regulator [Verrucomicrobiae bacterium]
MAGHSKWSKVKHFKGKVDAARSRAFSRCAKEIAIAARAGGGDPNFNPRLRAAIANAKAENMPNDNIERATKRGTGEIEGITYEEIVYEGYGPAGEAFLIEVTTDNKNRAAADLRSILNKNGGKFAAPGSVAHRFQRKGQILIPKAQIGEEELMGLALDAGAEDLKSDEDRWEILTPVEAFDAVLDAAKKRNLEPSSARLTFVPLLTATVTEESLARKALHLLEALDEHDDVQRVHSNFDVPDSLLAKLQE